MLLRGLLCCLRYSQLCMATMTLMKTSALWAIGWCGAQLALSGGASRWNPQPPAYCRHICHKQSFQHAQRLCMRHNWHTTRNTCKDLSSHATAGGNVSTGKP